MTECPPPPLNLQHATRATSYVKEEEEDSDEDESQGDSDDDVNVTQVGRKPETT